MIPSLVSVEDTNLQCQTIIENLEANFTNFTAPKQSSHTEQVIAQIEKLLNQLQMNINDGQIDHVQSLSTYTENLFFRKCHSSTVRKWSNIFRDG